MLDPYHFWMAEIRKLDCRASFFRLSGAKNLPPTTIIMTYFPRSQLIATIIFQFLYQHNLEEQ
jgi:hypothetical protein